MNPFTTGVTFFDISDFKWPKKKRLTKAEKEKIRLEQIVRKEKRAKLELILKENNISLDDIADTFEDDLWDKFHDEDYD